MFPKGSRRRAEDILKNVKATYDHIQIFSGATQRSESRR
jgi:hypothetical protein